MYIEPIELQGVYRLRLRNFQDKRGSFIKCFQADMFQKFGLRSDFRESFYTTSHMGTIRGMHFQEPPCEHAKLVTIVSGEVIDVVLDLRIESPTFKKAISLQLNSEEPTAVYISPGLAHGFATISEASTIMYMMTAEYSPECDNGVRWDSFGFKWPFVKPIISERDTKLPCLDNYVSPF